MLMLTRRPGESIHIGDGVVVTVAQIRGNQVRLGIAAPPAVAILRHELLGTLPRAARSEPEKPRNAA